MLHSWFPDVERLSIMHHDVEVARMKNGNITGEWEIFRPDLMPVGLEFKTYADFMPKEIQAATQSAIMTATENLNKHNRRSLFSWFRERAVPVNRSNAKRMFMKMRTFPDDSDDGVLRVILWISGLSITDNYWVRPVGTDRCWADIDIKRNEISKAWGLLGLLGSSKLFNTPEELAITNPFSSAAELSTNGTFPKGIFRENDELFMYKSGHPHTVWAEVIVSRILDCSNIYGHVRYEYDDTTHGVPCAKSKLITTGRKEIFSAKRLRNAISFARQEFPRAFAQMCVVDYLISNGDRHPGNWGFLRTAPAWEIVGLHDLFDNNFAFDYTEKGAPDNSWSVYDYAEGAFDYGLRQAAEINFNDSDFKFIKPLPVDIFKPFGKHANWAQDGFLKRCEFLGIGVEFG